MALFRSGNGSNADKIVVALELVDNDWFKRNFIGALELMCEQFNWEADGDATVDFARDKSNEMLESVQFNVNIPVLPIGLVTMWAASVVPIGWLLCDGQSILRSIYADLYSVIGLQYGFVDGTHFNVPDFRDRSPMGVGSNIAVGLGYLKGSETHTLSVSEMPAHDHPIARIGSSGGSSLNSAWTANTVPGTDAATKSRGGGSAHNNLHPIIGINFIIYAGI